MRADRTETERLLHRLLAVRSDAVDAAHRRADAIADVAPRMRAGAENLLHYLAVRGVDLRREQLALAERGLSSLGRAEAHVLATIDAVLARLVADLSDSGATVPDQSLPIDLSAVGPRAAEGRLALERHTEAAFGPAPAGRRTRVMVTLPTEAASDGSIVDRFVAAGMSVARINTAHDGPEAWAAMAAHVRRAADRHGRQVRIVVDLPGPKLRTGPVEPGPSVVKIRPERDDFGRVVRPGRLVLRNHVDECDPSSADCAADGGAQPEPDGLPVVSVDGWPVADTSPGDRIELDDARGRRRLLTVVDRWSDSIVVSTDRTVYLVPGLDLVHRRTGHRVGDVRVVQVPSRPGAIHLRAGDLLELRPGSQPGRDALGGSENRGGRPAAVSIDVPELFSALRPGARVLFDDGKIETVVEDASDGRATVRILRPDRARLRAEKGVNVPDLDLGIMSPTSDDRAILEHVAPFADLVALSYVSHPEDVEAVHAELDRLRAPQVGTVLKIEHRIAFERLPELLLTALRRPPVAVMVARGDLAVEIGYERLAEVQEEVLWLSEAAHVPVIWATQVLESLAKRGAPTRAEVTDAAWSIRAECVMLNKGPFIAETIAFLDDVLGRMSAHRSKRMPMLRRLSVAASAWDPAGGQRDEVSGVPGE
jgi:pyruvate kinase